MVILMLRKAFLESQLKGTDLKPKRRQFLLQMVRSLTRPEATGTQWSLRGCVKTGGWLKHQIF